MELLERVGSWVSVEEGGGLWVKVGCGEEWVIGTGTLWEWFCSVGSSWVVGSGELWEVLSCENGSALWQASGLGEVSSNM